ncbi:SMP-30/gluconolactonase/LRE family protein [Nocardia sp. NPDC004711]
MDMSTSRIRVVGVAATVVAGLLCATGSAQAAPGSCDGWQMDTLAQGLGNVENLETDGNGGFFVSGLEAHKLYDIDAAGNVTVVRDDFAYGPGGLQRDGSTLYVSGGMTDGTVGVHALDTATGAVTHVTDLTGNGLLRLPNGDLLTTWIGLEGTAPAGVSAYHHDTGVVQPNWAPVPRAEGLTLSPDGTAVYTDDMITGQIYRIPLDDPGHWTTVGRLGGVVPGDDDLTISQTGILYVAAHVGGSIDRLDPATGATCSIATGISWGWSGPSSVRIGPDGAGWALYVTAFDGTFRRIRPPAGVGPWGPSA